MAKKFRVRLKEYKTNELIGNENTVEYGDLFVEHRPLGTRFLLKHGTENNTNPRALKNIVNQKGFNYVDSGLHIIDAKQFAESLKGDINGVKVVDLDNYIEGGFYYIRGEANTGKKDEGVILKNSPYSIGLNSNEVNGSEFASYLQVIEWDSNHCKQIFLKQASEQIFVREKLGENWSDWKEVATSENSNIYKSLTTNNFDDYKTNGIYYFNDNDVANANNAPDPGQNGYLTVVSKKGESTCYQFWVSIRGASYSFVRSYSDSGGWRTWKNLIPNDTGWKNFFTNTNGALNENICTAVENSTLKYSTHNKDYPFRIRKVDNKVYIEGVFTAKKGDILQLKKEYCPKFYQKIFSTGSDRTVWRGTIYPSGVINVEWIRSANDDGAFLETSDAERWLHIKNEYFID